MKLTDRQERLLRRTFLDYQQTSGFLEQPLIVQRAEGLHYWDVEGKRYFDGIGGIFVAALGHRHPRVVEAVMRQMEKLTFSPPMHGTSDVALDLVERLGAVTPGNLNYVKPFSGGSESVEAALKFTRQYFKQTGRPGKYKFISRYFGYHGATAGAMAASARPPSSPRCPAFSRSSRPPPTGTGSTPMRPATGSARRPSRT
jgi:adenosylmethionine-8-amino-7-oxononanoate aminotransferase